MAAVSLQELINDVARLRPETLALLRNALHYDEFGFDRETGHAATDAQYQAFEVLEEVAKLGPVEFPPRLDAAVAEHPIVAQAVKRGAKLHQNDAGLWSVLDHSGTPLWHAFFLDAPTAAQAYLTLHAVPVSTRSPAVEIPARLYSQIVDLLRERAVIGAIKLLRVKAGTGFYEAKNAVEALHDQLRKDGTLPPPI